MTSGTEIKGIERCRGGEQHKLGSHHFGCDWWRETKASSLWLTLLFLKYIISNSSCTFFSRTLFSTMLFKYVRLRYLSLDEFCSLLRPHHFNSYIFSYPIFQRSLKLLAVFQMIISEWAYSSCRWCAWSPYIHIFFKRFFYNIKVDFTQVLIFSSYLTNSSVQYYATGILPNLYKTWPENLWYTSSTYTIWKLWQTANSTIYYRIFELTFYHFQSLTNRLLVQSGEGQFAPLLRRPPCGAPAPSLTLWYGQQNWYLLRRSYWISHFKFKSTENLKMACMRAEFVERSM